MAISTVRAGCIFAALAVASYLPSAALAIAIWDGGGRTDDNWTTGANWFALFGPGASPANNGTEDISMPALGDVETSIVDVPYNIRSLTFGNGDGRYVILGAAELTIGAGGITNNDADIQSIIGPVKLSVGQTWNAAAGRLQMDAVNLNGFTLALAGAHPIDLPSVILGTGMLTIADGYTSTVTMTGAASNTYNGATHVNGGTLVLNKTSGAIAIPASLYIESLVRLDRDEQIAQSGFVQVEAGGLLNLNGRTETFARLIVSPDGSVTTGAGRLNITQEFQVTGGDVTGNVSLGDVDADVTLDGHVSIGADLYIGDAGSASLSIRFSSSVSNANGYIGDDTGSMGEVTVDGFGSGWGNSGNLYVGNAGMGTLNITGNMTGGGLVSSTNGIVGNASGSVGVANVGTKARWTSLGDLYIGNAGNGELNITGGGSVSNVIGNIGDDAGSVGKVIVDGAGSTWNNRGQLFVGKAGDGMLEVTAGASVSSLECYIGANGTDPDGGGTVHVEGAGSELLVQGELRIRPHGALHISDGGFVELGPVPPFVPSSPVMAETRISEEAFVTIDGLGSKLIAPGDFSVAPGGELHISNGAEVEVSDWSFLGFSINGSSTIRGTVIVDTGAILSSQHLLDVAEAPFEVKNGGAALSSLVKISNTTVTVDGAGSRLFGGSLILADAGIAALSVTNGGTIEAPSLSLRSLGEIHGQGNIVGDIQNEGALRGQLNITGNLVNAGLVSPGTSPGTINVDGDYAQSADGELLIELASASSFDQLLVTGEAVLDGTVTVNLSDGFIPNIGQSFTILTADDVDGTFGTEVLPVVPNLVFDVIYNAQSVVLAVSSAGVPGDYNGDGTVDAADYVVWRKTLGNLVTAGTGADGNSNGSIDIGDYAVWRAQYGQTAGSSGSAGASPSHFLVPEPSGVGPMIVGLAALLFRHAARKGRATSGV